MPRMNRLAKALILSLLCCVVFTSSALAVSTSSKTAQVVSLRKAVRYYRTATWRSQKTALLKPSPSNYSEKRTSNIAYLRWDVKLWRHKYIKAQKYAQNIPHKGMWFCIHSGEASWTDHASNNPHYGGLQMGSWFMRTYAPGLLARYGTADKWPPLQQMWVAENAYKREHYSRSWLSGQWPATSPPCV